MDVKKFFAVVVENWPAKVLSLALAILLFVFHRMSTLETRSFFAPLAIQSLSALSPAAPYPGMIRVSVRGESADLYSILENDIEVYVDMEKINTPGSYNIPVKWRKKGTAQDVEPLQISVDPAEITFSLDRKISKYVPLVAGFAGQTETGYNMISHSLDPSQVIIEGPMALIGSIHELRTEPVDLSGRRRDFSLTTAILNTEPLITIRGDRTTSFFGTISQVIPVRNIPNFPISIRGLQEEFSGFLETRSAAIHLEGDNQEMVERFVPPQGFLGVDCSEIREPGIYILRVLYGSAEGVSLRVEPQEVRIRISQTGE